LQGLTYCFINKFERDKNIHSAKTPWQRLSPILYVRKISK